MSAYDLGLIIDLARIGCVVGIWLVFACEERP